MQEIFYAVGLDVDKASFKACLKVQKPSTKSIVRASRTFSNNLEGFKELEQWIKKHRTFNDSMVRIIMEATGVYHEHLAWHLYQGGHQIHVILPLRARRYLQSLGNKSKNDKIDAQGLADMCLQQDLDLWQPCSKNILRLRSLTRQLETLQEARTAFRNQLESATHLANCDRMVIRNLKSLIKVVEKDILNLRKRIEQFIVEDQVLHSKYKLMQPIKGFAIITFATLVAETGGFELFENQRQLVSYAGYDIMENQSGKRVGKTRISKQGNSHIRRIMHMASFNVVRYQVSPFAQLYERVYDRTKTKMKGYVAVQRKLLCLIYALWKNESSFNPDHSGNHDPKALFSVGPIGPQAKVATNNVVATLDGLPCNQSPEALFSVKRS